MVKKHSEETKEKIRQNHLGKKATLEARQKMSSSRQGLKCYKAKLTEEQVIEIRNLYKNFNYSTAKLSKKFNMSEGAIWYIVKYRSWKHLP